MLNKATLVGGGTVFPRLVKEVNRKHKILSNFCASTFKDGTKRFESTIAVILFFVQIASPLPFTAWNSLSISSAEAVLYSPDTKVPRTGELALRKAIPANTNMKTIQDSLEDISYLLRIPQRKPFGTMEGNVKKALKIAVDDKDSIMASIPADLREKGSELYDSLIDGKGGLKTLLECIKDKDPDKVSVGLASSLDAVAQLELLQAPGLSFLLPQQYLKYPRLTGRGIVELVIEKGDGATFSPEAGGEPRKTATIQVVLDGYSAPLTAGNFAKLVVDGAYNGVKLSCINQAILSDSKNSGYKLPVLPLSVYGAGQFSVFGESPQPINDGMMLWCPWSFWGHHQMIKSTGSEKYVIYILYFSDIYFEELSACGSYRFGTGCFFLASSHRAGLDFEPAFPTGLVILQVKEVKEEETSVSPPTISLKQGCNAVDPIIYFGNG
ncbi:hypothetical protein RHSIM_Rhsim06G0194400 [Rhododendron simsii]|uniref:Peptidyl-prolyl cis-trans isomerase CYP38-like PsbQ-like domain-containing protein n=1 Tax=Rhododendron simsii TaxID=118357 RepID=A0A834LLF8_RHOSS|nr:hypothetical protein RHSIM_Rhsim06G0194400 [Rhododendron simsii]